MRHLQAFNRRGIRAGLVIALLLISRACASAASAIWIDTDQSIGAPYREVDDAFALVLAFHSPEVRIAGISSTYGNAGLKRTTAVARNLAVRFDASAGVSENDVHAGAASPTSLGEETPAVAALTAALRKEQLTYVALGPLTNLATALRIHPELAARINRVIFVGGRTPDRPLAFGRNGRFSIHDANVVKDPAAVQLVLRSGIPLVLAAPEIAGGLLLTDNDAQQLAAANAEGRFLQRNSRVWLWFWTTIVRNSGGPLFDVLAMVAAIRPEIVATEHRYASVTKGGELLASRHRTRDATPVLFCRAVDARIHDFAMERLRQSPAPKRAR